MFSKANNAPAQRITCEDSVVAVILAHLSCSNEPLPQLDAIYSWHFIGLAGGRAVKLIMKVDENQVPVSYDSWRKRNGSLLSS
jgi:hypothetical protein